MLDGRRHGRDVTRAGTFPIAHCTVEAPAPTHQRPAQRIVPTRSPTHLHFFRRLAARARDDDDDGGRMRTPSYFYDGMRGGKGFSESAAYAYSLPSASPRGFPLRVGGNDRLRKPRMAGCS